MLHVAGDGYKKGTAAAVGVVESDREFSPVEEQASHLHLVGYHYVTRVTSLRGRLLIEAGHWDAPGISVEELPPEVRHITRGCTPRMKICILAYVWN